MRCFILKGKKSKGFISVFFCIKCKSYPEFLKCHSAINAINSKIPYGLCVCHCSLSFSSYSFLKLLVEIHGNAKETENSSRSNK